MRCTLPPHREPLSFTAYDAYEVHYRQAHSNRCTECGRNFPTDLFLTLHIEENHDSLVAARRERGEKTYGCFVEDCERKCLTPQKRRMHLIGKHMFPKSYNFYIVNDGIDKQASMLRLTGTQGNRRRLSSTPSSPKEGRLRYRQTSISKDSTVCNPTTRSEPGPRTDETDADMADLEKSMSALRFVPASVRRQAARKAGAGPPGALSKAMETEETSTGGASKG
ncbi:uncharacterized protein BDV17DRAFT_291326 [Aspergillus undulatus]|uniref:uncharacterized protein n=1 Tax=Aspergillus undulatus TaxID=1810928 RepID=UPI003CCCDDE0